MNKLLQRQMERFLGSVEAAPKDLAPLFRAIDDAYDGFDADRRLIERSLDISSEELTAINEQLRREIAEHRQVDAALQESEERFKQVAENAGEWIWEVDLEGRYTYCNPTVEKMLGYAPDEVVGKKYFFEFLLPHEREPMKKAIFEGFAPGSPSPDTSTPMSARTGASWSLRPTPLRSSTPMAGVEAIAAPISTSRAARRPTSVRRT